MLEAIRAIQDKAQAIESKYKESNAWLDSLPSSLDDCPPADNDSAFWQATRFANSPSSAHAALLAALGL